jgi:hypothetical protein
MPETGIGAAMPELGLLGAMMPETKVGDGSPDLEIGAVVPEIGRVPADESEGIARSVSKTADRSKETGWSVGWGGEEVGTLLLGTATSQLENEPLAGSSTVTVGWSSM